MPILGIILFVILYLVAAALYPGGSQANKNSVGFSWVNNYWCNLLNEYAVNGVLNPAKPLAVLAMIILCVSLSIFWFVFPIYAFSKKKMRRLIQICGVIAMAIASLLFMEFNHDLVSYLAAAFGIVAMLGTFIELFRLKWKGLIILGIVNFVFIVLNAYIYYTKDYIVFLPLIQKIAFAGFLIWIINITTQLYRQPIHAK